MTTALIVPFAGNDHHRLRAWHWLEHRYRTQHPDWQIVTGTCRGPWIKARAVEDALTRTDADLLIISDADVYCEQLPDFVEQVADGMWEWASPHWRVVRLNQERTAQVYEDGYFPEDMPNQRQLTERVYNAMVGGGIVIIPRALYERVPLDSRFVGWGGEDESWGRALLTLTRKRTAGHNVLWHLYHEPQARMNRRMGNVANRELTERYIAAAGDIDATERLIEEGRCRSGIISSSVPS